VSNALAAAGLLAIAAMGRPLWQAWWLAALALGLAALVLPRLARNRILSVLTLALAMAVVTTARVA
jgi:hypothetical protein